MKIAVISPFIDKSHGTERCVAELIERAARDYNCEVHLYSQRVADITITDRGAAAAGVGIRWHKVPSIPGPHLLQYIWWFIANTLIRWWHVRIRRCNPDLVFSPGINAW